MIFKLFVQRTSLQASMLLAWISSPLSEKINVNYLEHSRTVVISIRIKTNKGICHSRAQPDGRACINDGRKYLQNCKTRSKTVEQLQNINEGFS